MDSPALCSNCKSAPALRLPPVPVASSRTLVQLRSNNVPSPSEISGLSKLISEAEAQYSLYDAEITRYNAEITRYDAEITRLTKITERLKVEQTHIDLYIRQHRSLSALVRRLPAELLTMIFEACCGDRDLHNNQLANPIGLAPLNLGLVCRFWRDITLSTPQLWRSICVVLDDAIENTVGIVKLFLHNSLHYPLTIEIFDYNCDSMLMGPALDVAKTIALQCHRFKHLRLSGFQDTFGHLINGHELSCLESLYLSISQVASGLDLSLSLAGVAPKLCAVDLVNTISNISECQHVLTVLPFHRITHVKIEETYLESTLECLNMFPNATHVTLRMTDHKLGDDVRSYFSNQISSLELIVCHDGGDGGSCLGPLFKSITFPSLTSIAINCLVGDDYTQSSWMHDPFMTMLSRSHCQLEQFTLQNLELSESQLLQILELMPALTSITIHDREDVAQSVFTDTLLRRLAHSISPASYSNEASPNKLLPNLTRIDFAPSPSFSDYQVLADMIASRWAPAPEYSSRSCTVACLEQVTLRFANELHAEIVARLRNFNRKGLSVWLPGR